MSLRLPSLLAFLVCAALCAARSPASAQEAPSQDSAMARTLFVQGTKAAKDDDWAKARDSFAASYALHQSPRTLFNLGIARVQLGELVAGSEALRAFLRTADPSREAENVAIARRELLRIDPLIAYVRIDARGTAPSDQLEVDGRTLPSGALGSELPLDPGSHHIRWLRPERVLAEQSIEVKAGERATIALEAAAEPVRPASAVPPPQEVAPAPVLAPAAVEERAFNPLSAPQRDDAGTRRRRWLIGGGIAAVVIGAALGTFFIVRDKDETRQKLDPVEGNVVDGVWRIP